MRDILRGGYGDIGGLTVNTPLPLSERPFDEAGSAAAMFNDKKLFMPPYALEQFLVTPTSLLLHLLSLGVSGTCRWQSNLLVRRK